MARDIRSKQSLARFTPAEYARLEAAASADGRTVAAFIARVVLQYVDGPTTSQSPHPAYGIDVRGTALALGRRGAR